MKIRIFGYAVLAACILGIIRFGCVEGNLAMAVIMMVVFLGVLSALGSPEEDSFDIEKDDTFREVVGRVHRDVREVEEPMLLNGTFSIMSVNLTKVRVFPEQWLLIVKDKKGKTFEVPVTEDVYDAFKDCDIFPMYWGMGL